MNLMQSPNQAPVISRNPGYLLGPRFDTTFILLPVVLGLAFCLTATANMNWLLLLVLADVWLFGYHHVIATFTKLAGTRQDRKDNHALIYYLPFIILACVGIATVTLGAWSVVTVYFFWQWYHYVRQSYGISTFYSRKSGHEKSQPAWLVNLFIWAVPIWGVLNRCAQNSPEFLMMPIWLPPVPQIVVTVAGIVALGSVFGFALNRIQAVRAGTLSLPYTAYMLSHFMIFAIGYVFIENITAGWLAANVWHNLQYMMFVWLYNTNRFSKPSEGSEPSIVAALSKRTALHVFAYFAATLLTATVIYKILEKTAFVFTSDEKMTFMIVVIISQAANFHHYVVDSKIWKARNKANQATMGVK